MPGGARLCIFTLRISCILEGAAARINWQHVCLRRFRSFPGEEPSIRTLLSLLAVLLLVLANGFYITPALLGGANDQLISSLIADFALGRANWGMASALALVLLLAIAIVFVVFGPFSRTRGARA